MELPTNTWWSKKERFSGSSYPSFQQSTATAVLSTGFLISPTSVLNRVVSKITLTDLLYESLVIGGDHSITEAISLDVTFAY